MISQIPMPKGALVIKDITHQEFANLIDSWQRTMETVPDNDLEKIIVIGGHDAKYISFEDKALKLWRELVNYLGDYPFTDDTTDYGKEPTCFFCSHIRPTHDLDCIYLRAKKLLEEQKC